MVLQRGVEGARQARICDDCKNRQHTECAQEKAIMKLREQREMKAEGFGKNDPEIRVPFCACYSETDLHL